MTPRSSLRGHDNDFVTYGELAETVQDVTGIRTRMQMRNWIGKVLAEVVRECVRRGEPPPLCPIHYLALPATAICDECA
ncbi:hypothetical protein [Nocardia aurea]|uniref:hypothetical protein n=1 Tax=Nocardia aurea TaxID=2144174 RepID=UPI000D68CB9E|nr:hypothetical protein [Nocardia aurea]